ncbi:RIP metalloprotease RseP [Comamonas endophytica]|uniref:Zinc metalloprotease n=1 Tax=Comamonas endophytica TaxID=2949090 RepID=A0ABY6GAX5_9BURK|nr:MULTISPECIES: RIP metalloprotease RseP [unclassified Acidovorax]MCD2513807.1 RIP metalloprotease RseP [Acidovorax sp. D4N7]UYG52190.1 RIP metalloprotease RseP [Acidovorax sp. 5MLIR]
MLMTVLAFVIALGVLIAVHEYGHYRVAVACGVKVLRFSVGFGKPLLRWRPKGSSTEFVLAAFPLGGYVRMLDEREGAVAPEERHLAFNNQPLRARAAIVAAGPAANLLLAVLLYAGVNWVGIEEPKPFLASPGAGSLAQAAGLQGGERVQAVARGEGPMEPVRSFDEVRWALARAALEGQDARLELVRPQAGAAAGAATVLQLPLGSLETREADERLFERIGVVAPWTPAVMGELLADGAARRAGLREGDRVLSVGPVAVRDGQQLRSLIRASVRGSEGLAQDWRIERGGQTLQLSVRPDAVQQDDQWVGRIGAFVGAAPEMTLVRRGFLEGLQNGAQRTWDLSVLTLRMMGRMVIGEASIKNISGPLTIADYAGKSASMGITQYLAFLALISVSLGVLNLLPLPVLDGGHLMYYLWEGVTGRPVSEAWMERLQRLGVALLLLMMGIAFFNDINRLLG